MGFLSKLKEFFSENQKEEKIETEKKIDYLKASGYDVLIIWENDFKTKEKEVIQQCLDFLYK